MQRTPVRILSLLSLALTAAACGGSAHLPPAETTALSVTAALPDGRVGEPYTASISGGTGGGMHTWRLDSGSLPPGVALLEVTQGATTTLFGSPTLTGTFEFTVRGQGTGSTTLQKLSIQVAPCTRLVDGWTDFQPEPGARIVHVSATGNDANAGTMQAPRRTLAGGFALLRSGMADWLLLRRGDSFVLNASLHWNKSGPAVGSGWMRLGAYGDENLPRPMIMGSDPRIVVSPGYQSTNTIRRVAISDVFFCATDRLANSTTTTSNPIAIHVNATAWQGSGMPFSEILVENCRISGFTFGFACGTDAADVAIRRCIFDHIFMANGAQSSAILSSAQTLLLEENIIYRVMSADIPGVTTFANSQFSHAIYVAADARDVTATGNIVIKAPDGMMHRAGGHITRNACVQTFTAGSVGQAWGVTPTPGGVQTDFSENLLLDASSFSLYLGNIASGSVRENMLLQDQHGQGQTDLSLQPYGTAGNGANIGVHNTTFAANLLSGTISWNTGNTTSFTGLLFQGNLQNIGPTSTSIAAYLQAVSWPGSTFDDWAFHLLLRDRNNFTPEFLSTSVINFYRQHYGLPPLQ